MPDDSAGNYSPPPGYLAVTGQTVLASQHNPPIEDSAAAMSRRYMRDGRAPMLGNIPMNGYRATGAGDAVDQQDYVTFSQLQGLLSEIYGVPTGRLMIATGMQVEDGYVIANGQSLSRVNYPALWAYAQASDNLAATHGSRTAGQYSPGNGATTFAVPNLYADGGYFIRPISSGRTIGSVQADEIKSHTHSGQTNPSGGNQPRVRTNTGTGGSYVIGGATSAGGLAPAGAMEPIPDHIHGFTTDQTGGPETRPQNIAFQVLIKT